MKKKNRITYHGTHTDLEKVLIEALLNSCAPGCSHEGCNRKNVKAYAVGCAVARAAIVKAPIATERAEASKELEDTAWDEFSNRYSGAKREECEWFPHLRTAWEEWRDAWMGGVAAARAACNVEKK